MLHSQVYKTRLENNMKQYAPIFVFFSPVFGNYQIMRRSLTERLNLTNSVADRGLANFLVAGLDNFKNYGCWCYLDGAPGKGRSNPIQ